ncbi:MAG: RagB/SusD family nutrient uptake outer membrane protein [Flavobacteriales bacterium]|nr:MAG: RagB/SusD family nutrient uptake outer membrane protein [Flavobacteriales bacterium]
MKRLFLIYAVLVLTGCKDKLDIKPDTSLVLPVTVQDFEALLDNATVMNRTAALPHLSADEYIVPSLAVYNSLGSSITQNAYTWQADTYQGQGQILDWNIPYSQVFICNSVLDALTEQGVGSNAQKQRIQGWALFARAYAFYDLASTFCKAYNEEQAGTDLGIPLKLSAAVTDVQQRSTLSTTYQQIVDDATRAAQLLQAEVPNDKRNRPSKVAAYALLARVFTSMRDYQQAEQAADLALAGYSKLIDYNTLVQRTNSSFTYNSEETIYFSHCENSLYAQLTSLASAAFYSADPEFLKQYHPCDLRKSIYFRLNANGNYGYKGVNSVRAVPFTGLATDELILIKAECLARRGEVATAMQLLDQLLVKRWNPNATMPATPYTPISVGNSQEALDRVLLERRKSLIYRCIRWTDLKRLNLEGANITLTRELGSQVYQLLPNSNRYAMPIPDDEIALSGIKQNNR